MRRDGESGYAGDPVRRASLRRSYPRRIVLLSAADRARWLMAGDWRHAEAVLDRPGPCRDLHVCAVRHTGLKSGHQDPPLPGTDSLTALSSNIPPSITLGMDCTGSVMA